MSFMYSLVAVPPPHACGRASFMACCTDSLRKARSSARGLTAQTGTWVSPPHSTGRGSWQAESVATGPHA
eukprot:6013653-Prorocentrum_lima.AAC.1